MPTNLEFVCDRSSELELCIQTLRRTQEQLWFYRTMYENIPCVYFSLDANGSILSVNPFGAEYLGYAPEELIQKPIFQLLASKDQQKLANALIGLLTETPLEVLTSWEFQLACPTNKIQWVKVVARVILPDREKNPIIMMVWEDITAYKQAEDSQALADAEAALTQSQQMVQAHIDETNSLNRLKEEFLSTVSHELRTPLTNMKMAIQMLGISLNQNHNFFAEMAKPQTEFYKAARYFQILTNECDREINLINNFLDLQRLDTSNKPLVLETIRVQEWVEQVIALFNARNHNCCDHKLQLDIAPNLPPLICDPFSLERILIELLTNACKFSPTGETITISAELEANNLQLTVTNFGVEIPSHELPRIFEKFYRIPSNDPKKQGGTGLGLALVQKLIKHLGGTIQVGSQCNFTYFTIELPLLIDL
ncbi:PAS domain-containing sensor histidine kinase [Aetokthonos hydrillicola]